MSAPAVEEQHGGVSGPHVHRVRRAAGLPGACVLVLALVLVPSSGARAASRACAAPRSERHHIKRVDLDRDGARERVDVYNFAGTATPVTTLMVCGRVQGHLVVVQRRTLNVSPGSPESGLVHAWIGDLNRDGRVEVAVRDYLTPSAGEVLTILRQAGARARTFRSLQRIAGDRVVMVPSSQVAATVRVDIKANHAADGRAHVETWRWSSVAHRWVCRRDCGGRPRIPCSGSVAGPLGTSAEGIEVKGMTCGAARTVIRHWLQHPHTPVDGFTITSPQRFHVHGRRAGEEFWFALMGTD